MPQRTKGISGLSIAMIGVGALLVRSAITGKNPIEEARALLTGQKPEPLSATSRGTAISGSADPAYTFTPAGGGGGGKARTVGARPHVAQEAEYIASTWGIVADATLVSSGHVTNSDHYTGHAIDAMVGGGNAGMNIGNAIFNYYRMNAQAKRIKYIIWQHTIWSPDRGSRTYSKNDHLKHVHLSFYPIIRGAQ